MPRDPENHSSHDYEDEKTEYQYDWTTYDEHLRSAETHLNEFIFMADHGRSDLVIGQQAQNTLEFAMKALLEAHQAPYRGTQNIGVLLGNIRHGNPEFQNFHLSIPPDVYTAYEGDQQHHPRSQPRLTDFPDYRERTTLDADTIMNRAGRIRAQRAENRG